MKRFSPVLSAAFMTAACSQADTTEIDASFAAFCDEHPFFMFKPECVDQDTVSAEQKQEIMDNAPTIEDALEDFEKNSDVEMKVLEE